VGPVIGDLLPLALGVAISPVPMIAVILMLLSPRARATSLGFLVGWVAGVAVVVTVVALVVDPVGAGDDGEPSTLVSVLKLVLGLAAVGLAVKQWRGRPTGGAHGELPGWMASIDKMTPVRALGLAAVLAGVNPKNLTLCLAAGVTVGGADLSVGDASVALVVFVVIASSTVAVPVLGYLVAQRRMAQPLEELRAWLTDNNAVVMSVLLLVIGVVIVGKGLSGL
jgi:Sap-like sulfolipid-1-addressing protein